MRAHNHRADSLLALRRSLERLDGLPLRPATVRHVFASLPDLGVSDDISEPEPIRIPPLSEWDPGWVLAHARTPGQTVALNLIAESPWWLLQSGPGADILNRLWRHAAAVRQAAWRLAKEAGDPEPERVARAGFLHGLGIWCVACLDPEWAAGWFEEKDLGRRREREREALGIELTSWGRRLAERWQCDPLVIDAAWLHADSRTNLKRLASDPARLSFIQQAFQWAEQTPWALHGESPREIGSSEPRLRILIAEVQVKCASAFVEPDATTHEERFARENARLRLRLAEQRAENTSRERFIHALADADPSESPELWAERAARSWCSEPGVATSRVLWNGSKTPGDETALREGARPPKSVLPLRDGGQPCAEIHLWPSSELATNPQETRAHPTHAAWQSWARLLAQRVKAEQRLETLLGVHRESADEAEVRFRQAKLDSLAEFAAGAGHELNNPLAVILGRAQLLLANEVDPTRVRSLRAIIGQAQRAHRILRDLMYVARVPEPRPRICQPDEIARSCVRDLRAEAESRGVRLNLECGDSNPRVWVDQDALRQLLEALLRNALEATPKGGKIQVSSSGDAETLRWTVHDTGRGISALESQHLFDPFYCGRQAGRGLGLGLPRAARLVARSGGELRWHSTPGQGSTFQVHLPLCAPPKPPVPTPTNPLPAD